ncbi:zinc ribbon domain-containing protein [Sphingobium sp.]|uniref:Zn-ribbon domain-containing OB-fold protein n=1 Tax=Sphingobium sp. TaxID=1912891 RepID=UPI0028BDFA3B|nr:zinc ribbon domain-containing protein [Sphingobium sp.]
MMAESIDPVVNALNRPFWDGADEGRLVLPHCVGSGRTFWPPSPASPFTGGAVDWRAVEPLGRVVTVVTYQRAFQQAFARLIPYAVAQVDVAGVRLQVHVPAGVAVAAGDEVEIGFRRLSEDGRAMPVISGGQVG